MIPASQWSCSEVPDTTPRERTTTPQLEFADAQWRVVLTPPHNFVTSRKRATAHHHSRCLTSHYKGRDRPIDRRFVCLWNKYYTQVSSLSCVSLFTGALGRARPFPLAQKMPSLAYQMIEIYVFFPPCFTVYVSDVRDVLLVDLFEAGSEM